MVYLLYVFLCLIFYHQTLTELESVLGRNSRYLGAANIYRNPSQNYKCQILVLHS